jgi:hypothetical protein
MADESSLKQSAQLRGVRLELASKAKLLASSRAQRQNEEVEHPGGLRNPHHAKVFYEGLASSGKLVRAFLEKKLAAAPELAAPVDDLRAGRKTDGYKPELIAELRSELFSLLAPRGNTWQKHVSVQAFVKRFGEHSGDTDARLHLWRWLSPGQGAPMGIKVPIPTSGVFPFAERRVAERLDYWATHTAASGWTNYQSAEACPVVVTQLLEEARSKGFCLRFNFESELCQHLGALEYTLQRLGLLSKLKANGELKHRLVWDFKRSQTNEFQTVLERVVLPRHADVVADARALRSSNSTGEPEALVIDFSDAFHNVPVRREEQVFNTCKAGGFLWCFTVLVFGSATSPAIWGRVAAFLGRALTSAFDESELRAQIYVDDPIITTWGSGAERRQLLTLALLWLSILGIPLAWRKADIGTQLDWIGASLAWSSAFVIIAIPKHRVEEYLVEITAVAKGNIVEKSRLSKLAGGLSFYAGIVPQLKPFVRVLWGACHSGSAATSWVLTRRFAHAMSWLKTFFRELVGALEQCFPLGDTAAGNGSTFIAVDASLTGGGGVLYSDGALKAWFAFEWADATHSLFNLRRGEPANMCLFEALTFLLAARLWLPLAATKGCRVKSDNIAALRLAINLSSRSSNLNRVGMELALDLALGRYVAEALEHIPGVSNIEPDALSRLKGGECSLPVRCRSDLRVTVPALDRSYFRVAFSMSRTKAYVLLYRSCHSDPNSFWPVIKL